MTPKLVTFDCAATLVDLKWSPSGSVRLMTGRLGLELPDEAFAAYGELFLEWRPHYERANLTRDPAQLREFWSALYRTWLELHGYPAALAERFLVLGEELAYSGGDTWFPPFPDTRPCLERLRNQGMRMAVVSNWDLSLSRVLESIDLLAYFERVIASLEEGPEKPDPALFRIALERLGVEPNEVVHVGDSPRDDIDGAQAAGIRALLLDRRAEKSRPGVIRSLDELPEGFAWSA
ncbi:HAD family hydrolase [Fimbriimonas ginsengisoli]|uniref:HAD-superfamily hydrolase, subfamily IA, variant 1 n=1 Tax=Fimbriimonas ginsengisoli Gsoil 348 TaxID=661478 RepID=A0A068NX30_FIMGI|nr:HAD-IA family hydrolase [Fimbriimonas ginsengisoli]AIE86174.1 HAD-superfamily hydrolase, subfamily IA, variant 1 [Fimbriimonas ginsengisoli Gsoil 348]